MGLQVKHTYITPVDASGATPGCSGEPTWVTNRGVFTLLANTTYYFALPVNCCTLFDAHLTHDAAIVITSAKIETCSHSEHDVADNSTIAGEWIDQDPSTAFVGLVGSGDSATNGVAAANGSAAGGMDWQASDFSAGRARITVVVGATGGEVRLSFCGKE